MWRYASAGVVALGVMTACVMSAAVRARSDGAASAHVQAAQPLSVSALAGSATARDGQLHQSTRPAMMDRHARRGSPEPLRSSLRGSPTTWFVNAAAAGADDGTSWADAFSGAIGLQSALAAAQSGDDVWVAAGIYLPSISGDRDASFLIPDGVAVYGGFDGTETQLQQRNADPLTNATILSGDLNADDAAGFANIADNAKRIVNANGTTSATIIDGLTISSAYAEENGSLLNAGGLSCEAGSPVVRNCRFMLNTARRGGGAYVENSSPVFEDCHFLSNRALADESVGEGNGGAVSIMLGSQPSFLRCHFMDNEARIGGAVHIAGAGASFDDCDFDINRAVIDPDYLGGLGGAMYINSPDAISMTACMFASNTGRQGGAIDMEGSSPQINGCTFVGNIATTDPVAGGGLGGAATIAFSSTPSFEDCQFNSNAGRVGAGVHVFDSSPTFTMCGFDDNEAVADASLGGGFGGAINLLGDSDATFTQCTIENNEARQGGGVQIEASLATFDGCTFFINAAPTTMSSGFGGAVLCLTDGDATFLGTSFTGNTSTFGGAVFSFAATPAFADCQVNLNGADQSGGAMYLQDSGEISFQDCTFETNTAVAGGGGALYVDATNASLRGCGFVENEAASGSGGALIFINGSAGVVVDCTFDGNEATTGGGIRVNNSPVQVRASTFMDNIASSSGGGIDFAAASTAMMHSCLLFGNSAAFGGGVHVSGLGPVLSNLTITENTSDNGAGIRVSNVGDATITNSIVWNNAGAETGVGPSSTLAVSFSNVQGGAPGGGTGNINVNPMFVDAANDDFTLGAGSPSIDAGSNAAADACGTDRALNQRIADGAGAFIVDMGAYEAAAPAFADCNSNGVLDSCDIADMTESDCNSNGVPDTCDIASGNWLDDDDNGIPDLCERIAGDVDGDGVVNLADLLAVITGWGFPTCCPDPCTADLDFDCSVGLSDLLAVISNWGSVGR